MALNLKTGCVLEQGLLQLLDLALKRLDIVQVLVLLGHFRAELVVNGALLLSHEVCVLLVEEYSRLLGCQEGHGCLRTLLTGNHNRLLYHAPTSLQVRTTEIATSETFLFELTYLLLLPLELVF